MWQFIVPAAMAAGSYLLNKNSTDDANSVAKDMNKSISDAGKQYKADVRDRYADSRVNTSAFNDVQDTHEGYKQDGYSLSKASDYVNPALAFAQKNAMNQIQGSAAGSGTLFSGGTAKEIADRTNMLAYQAYQDALSNSTAETARLDRNADSSAARAFNVQQANNAGRAGERDHFTNLAGQLAGADSAIYQGKVQGAQAIAGAKMGKTGAGTDLMNLGLSAAKIYSGLNSGG